MARESIDQLQRFAGSVSSGETGGKVRYNRYDHLFKFDDAYSSVKMPRMGKFPVPAKDVRLSPGVFNTKRYADFVQMPELYVATAEEPEMGYGVFTTRGVYPGTYMMHYGTEISRARAKELSDKV